MFSTISKIIERIFDNSEGVYIHGQILCKLLTGETIKNHDVMQLFCPFIKDGDISKIIEGINEITILSAFRQMNSNSINSNVPNIFICSLDLEDLHLFLEFHTLEEKKFMFDTDSVVLTKNGLQMWTDTNQSSYSSLDLVTSIRNMSWKKCQYLADYKSVSKFGVMIHQNKKINEGYVIENGLQQTLNKEQCPVCFGIESLYILKCTHKFCSSCLDKHQCSFSLAHKDDCPVCRQPIEF